MRKLDSDDRGRNGRCSAAPTPYGRVKSTGEDRFRREPSDRRGQTTLDFTLGISVFLLTLLFVFTFVPGMIEPFTTGAQAETTAVNRVADDITLSRLGNASRPFVLDPTCTEAFFTAGAPASCQFEGGSTAERVGVVERTHVNVTVRGDVDSSGTDDVLCVTGGGSSSLAERGAGTCATVLSRGPKPVSSGGKTVTATRVASLDGHDVTVEVVMW